jgi:2-haloacid dehalogenase
MPYVFDAYGTLFDFNAAIGRHRAAAGPDADRFSEIWRGKQIEYTWTLTLAGRYVEFWTLTQRALDTPSRACRRCPALRPPAQCHLKLAPFPRKVLREEGRGDRPHPVQRLAADAASAVAAAGIKNARCGSRSTPQMFKPRPEVYALVTAHFSVKPAEVTFVSSNRWDAMGATAFGFRTVWVNRAKAPDEYNDLPPAAVVPDLMALLSLPR